MENLSPIMVAFLGTGLAAISTMLGASLVFFFKKGISVTVQKLFLGFAAGIMIVAAIWVLFLPSLEYAKDLGMNKWLSPILGLSIGGLFLFSLDWLLPKLQAKFGNDQSANRRVIMLVSAIALHNIPEGLAVGIMLGTSAATGSSSAWLAASVLSIGMILHNFPEGAAISIPLRREGLSSWKSFIFAAIAAIVEPIAGVLGVILVGSIEGVMPFLLAFAAGAMLYVVVRELLPEANQGNGKQFGTFGTAFGVILMFLMETIL